MRAKWTKKSAKSGYSLVELIVVMAIGTLLASLAIPSIARLGSFSANELGDTSTELYTMLKAARIYASTYNTEAAVAYTLDNYDPFNGPLRNPISDSITGEVTRAITGAALMRKDKTRNVFVPINDREGTFREFPSEVVIALITPDQFNNSPLYTDMSSRYQVSSGDQLGKLGMGNIEINFKEDEPATTEALPAHIFTPAGQLSPNDTNKERYSFMIMASPDLSEEERLVFPGVGFDNQTPASEIFVSRRIELFRSTGRVRIAE